MQLDVRSPDPTTTTPTASNTPAPPLSAPDLHTRLGSLVGYMSALAVLRRPDLSEPVAGEGGPRVALIAARLGRTRLIDNIEFQ